MKNKSKKTLSLIISFALMLFAALGNSGRESQAATDVDLTLYVSSGTINVGDTVEVTVSISANDFVSCDISISYDSSLLQLVSSGSTVNISGSSGSSSVTFKAIAAGDAYVQTYTEGYGMDTERVNVTEQGASITIVDPSATTTEATTEATTEKTTESTSESTSETTTEATTKSDLSDNNNLLSLSVDPGKLEPEFSSSVTEYKLQVEETVKKVNISAVAEDEKAQVYISGNEDLEKGANTAKITVTAENGAYKTYVINITVGEDLGDPIATIDGKKYDVLEDISIDPPEGFTETTAKFDKWVVKAYESPNKKFKVICLKAQEVAEGQDDTPETWYFLDEKDNYIKKYQEYSSEKQRIIIVDYPATSSFRLDAFTETQLKIGEETVKAYVSDLDKDIYLVYGYEVNGDDNYYLYDAKTKSFMRYSKIVPDPEPTTEAVTEATTEKVNTIVIDNTKKVEDKGFFSKKNLKIMLIGMTAMFILLCIATIILVIRLGNVSHKLEKKEKVKGVDEELDFDEDNVEEYEKDTDEFFEDPEKVYDEAQVAEEATDEYATEEYAEDQYVEEQPEEYSEEYSDEAVQEASEDYYDQEMNEAVEENTSYDEAAEEYAEEAPEAYDETSAFAQEAQPAYEQPAYEQPAQPAYEQPAQPAQPTYVEESPVRTAADHYASTTFKKYDGGVTGKIEISEVVEASEVTNTSGMVSMGSYTSSAAKSDRDYASVAGSIFATTEAGGINASGVMSGESSSKKVTDDTIGIQLEDAIDNNSSVNVPPVSEESSREAAMKTRPYGIDSAFDVIEEDKYNEIASAAEQATTDITDVIAGSETSRSLNAVKADPTVSAAAAAFANIRKTVEESKEEPVQTVSDDDIVFPSGIDK